MISVVMIAALAGRPENPTARPPAAIVEQYFQDLQQANFAAAFRLLDPAGRAYFREPANFRSMYVADGFRVKSFTIVGRRSDVSGSVIFVRETARFRDHAHDTDLLVTATVPIGVLAIAGHWEIKDPGHPWRAFAPQAFAERDGLFIRVKKLSFFARRIEVVVTVQNRSVSTATLLPYGKSTLHDTAATSYSIIQTRDWMLTDKVFFEGLRLVSGAQYTGTLAFACEPLDDRQRRFRLMIAPILFEGSELPFSLDVVNIAAP